LEAIDHPLEARPAEAQNYGGRANRGGTVLLILDQNQLTADNGWFFVRPSRTEDIFKIYAESFRNEAHLRQIQQDAQEAVARGFRQPVPADAAWCPARSWTGRRATWNRAPSSRLATVCVRWVPVQPPSVRLTENTVLQLGALTDRFCIDRDDA
jgi:hypothetical protein